MNALDVDPLRRFFDLGFTRFSVSFIDSDIDEGLNDGVATLVSGYFSILDGSLRNKYGGGFLSVGMVELAGYDSSYSISGYSKDCEPRCYVIGGDEQNIHERQAYLIRLIEECPRGILFEGFKEENYGARLRSKGVYVPIDEFFREEVEDKERKVLFFLKRPDTFSREKIMAGLSSYDTMIRALLGEESLS